VLWRYRVSWKVGYWFRSYHRNVQTHAPTWTEWYHKRNLSFHFSDSDQNCERRRSRGSLYTYSLMGLLSHVTWEQPWIEIFQDFFFWLSFPFYFKHGLTSVLYLKSFGAVRSRTRAFLATAHHRVYNEDTAVSIWSEKCACTNGFSWCDCYVNRYILSHSKVKWVLSEPLVYQCIVADATWTALAMVS
jgi:hypothetical protein